MITTVTSSVSMAVLFFLSFITIVFSIRELVTHSPDWDKPITSFLLLAFLFTVEIILDRK